MTTGLPLTIIGHDLVAAAVAVGLTDMGLSVRWLIPPNEQSVIGTLPTLLMPGKATWPQQVILLNRRLFYFTQWLEGLGVPTPTLTRLPVQSANAQQELPIDITGGVLDAMALDKALRGAAVLRGIITESIQEITILLDDDDVPRIQLGNDEIAVQGVVIVEALDPMSLTTWTPETLPAPIIQVDPRIPSSPSSWTVRFPFGIKIYQTGRSTPSLPIPEDQTIEQSSGIATRWNDGTHVEHIGYRGVRVLVRGSGGILQLPLLPRTIVATLGIPTPGPSVNDEQK